MLRQRTFHLLVCLFLVVLAVAISGLALFLRLAGGWDQHASLAGSPVPARAPQLLYLGWPDPDAEARQLFLAPLDGSPSRQLTDQAGGVWDYAVDPRGEEIVYSVLRDDGGADLWRMDRDGAHQRLLLACPSAACLAPAWSADGQQLAYERRDVRAGAPDLDPQAGRIWLFDLQKGKERSLFNPAVPLHSPAWAPQGQQLAFVSPLLPGVQVYDLDSGDLQQFPNEWGSPPAWSPDAADLVLPELMAAGEEFIVHLFRIHLVDGQAVDISGDQNLVKDASPAWSPAGDWIAFGRQVLDDEQRTPGRQMWLAHPDGSEAHALLDDPMGDFFAFAWRPDGGALAYVRSDLSEGPQPVPGVSVWVFDLAQGKPVVVAQRGVLPKWLP
jgi:Tol biopolymer transport system component